VCHTCDNRLCCNPTHLFLGTYRDNAMDAVKKGRITPPGVKGEKHGRSKITARDVIKIRKRLCGEESQVSIAKDFSVGQTTISAIATGKTWK